VSFYQLVKTIKSQDYDDEGNRFDVIMKVLKDEETGEKIVETIPDPDFTYYVTDDDYVLDEQVNYIEKEKVREITCSSSNIVKSVAYETGNEDFFWKCIKSKKFSAAKAVFLDPNVHGSDIDLEDYYIGKHYSKYPVEQSKNEFTKGFFDIEVDSMKILGFPNPADAECPVNAISFFNDSNMTLYGLFLRNSENPLIEEFETNRLKDFKKRMKQKYKDKGLDIKLKLIWYNEEDELSLIADFFHLINLLKPDFASGWNIFGFDIEYLINRIAQLGATPNDIICAEDIPYKYCYLSKDTKNQDPADKGDYFSVSSYTNYLDQMLLFANLRKGAGKRESYSLDAIAFEELGENKLEFKNPDTTTKNSAWMDYEEFIEYNLHDTMLLHMIEARNKDFNMIYAVAAKTETRIQKALKKTVCLKNLARRFYFDRGYIMSNNHNTNYGGLNETVKESFRGAFVANPLLNKPLGLVINGSKSKYIFENVIDFDLTSLYPSIILAFNVDATTQIGRIESDEFDSPKLVDDIVTRNYINIGKDYFDLPNVTDMLELLENRKIA